MLLVNHGGAADDFYPDALATGRITDRPRLIVSVLSPASTYMNGVVRLLRRSSSGASVSRWWRPKRLSRAPSPPVPTPIQSAPQLASRRTSAPRILDPLDPAHYPGVLLAAFRRNRINAVLSAAVMRTTSQSSNSASPIPPIFPSSPVSAPAWRASAATSAPTPRASWAQPMGTRLRPRARTRPFAGRIRAPDGDPRRLECDYPAAQAYAAGLVTVAALRNAGALVTAPASRQTSALVTVRSSRPAGALDQARLRNAFADLHTTTLFGDFAIDPASGRQLGHQMLLVQWHRGRKVLIDAEPDPDAGAVEFPSGWRMVLTSLNYFRLTGGAPSAENPADGTPPAETLPREAPDEIDDDQKP